MKHKLLLLLAALLLAAALPAQTIDEKLEKAVRIYNHMRDFEDELKPGSVKLSDIDTLLECTKQAKPLLDDVKRNGNAEQAKVARYFNANFQYELGFVYGMMGKNRDAYPVLNDIKGDYDYFTASSFPMSYKYDNKTYSITYDNFAPTLSEYYTGMGEICANLSKSEEALYWARKSFNFPQSTDWYRYIALNKILETKKKLKEWDKEMIDMGLEQIKTYAKLDTGYLRTVKENKYPTQQFGYEIINAAIDETPALAKGEYHRGTAAPILAQLKDYSKAVFYYNKAISGGFADNNKQYLFEAVAFFKQESDRESGLIACNKLLYTCATSLSCDEWNNLAEYYNYWNESAKARQSREMADECLKEQRRQAKKTKVKNTYGQSTNFSISSNPTNFLYNGQLVAADFRVKSTIFEFRYQNFDDVTSKGLFGGHFTDPKKKWENVNGADYGVSILFSIDNDYSSYKNSSTIQYVGFQAQYSEFTSKRESVQYTDHNTSTYQSAMVSPAMQKQELTMNYGMMIFSRKTHLFFNMYMGFGVGRRTIKYNNTNGADLADKDRYEFENSEQYAGYRQERWNKFYPQVRMGMRLGITIF